MPIYMNGTEIYDVSFNGQLDNPSAPTKLYHDGVLVWPAAPVTLTTLMKDDPNVIQRVVSYGRRAESDGTCNANHVRNWIVATNLQPGRKYAYFLTTSGKRTANRMLSDGTVISSNGYDSANAGYESASTTWKMWKDNGVGYTYTYSTATIQLSSWGKFEYTPRTYSDSCGNSVTGHYICGNTYNVSDAGKGDANCYIFDYAYVRYFMEFHGISGWYNKNIMQPK
jgi:hypothetical protein